MRPTRTAGRPHIFSEDSTMLSKGRLLAALCLACSLLVSAGCKKSNPLAPARISGKVTYAGAPIPGGTVIFHTADGGSIPANIAADGSYGTELGVGEVIVTIETESVNPARKVPTYDERTAGGGSALAKMYGKSGGGGTGSSKNKAGNSMPETSAPPVNNYVKIPPRYADKNKSGLTLTLVKGDQKKDFDLTD